MSWGWLVAICIAFVFYIYHCIHSKCHVPLKKKDKDNDECKVCLAQRKLQLAKPVKTARDLREQPIKPKQKDMATQTDEQFQLQRRGLDVGQQTRNFYPNERNLPFKSDIFRTYTQLCTEFAVEYLGNNKHMRNVTAELAPGFLINNMPTEMPETPVRLSAILDDINRQLLPGLIHRQHPRCLAFYPHGCSYPDMMAEFLIASIGDVKSPAFAELEILMVNWLGKAIGLSDEFLYDLKAPKKSKGGGAFQTSSSDAFNTALLAARDRKLAQLMAPDAPDFRKKKADLLSRLVAYTNIEAQSSIEKIAKVAMVRLHPVNPGDWRVSADESMDEIEREEQYFRGKSSMRGWMLEYEIKKDLDADLIPFYVQATSGTPADASLDNLEEICTIAEKYGLWVHADASYVGGAMICPEHSYFMRGINKVNSINLDAHKFLLVSCNCSILWTREQETIHKAFAVSDDTTQSMDFRSWGINESQRVKALKLWLVFRMYGLHGLQDHIRHLIRLTDRLEGLLREEGKHDILIMRHHLTVITFRLKGVGDRTRCNQLTKALCGHINSTHKLLVNDARANGYDVVRLSVNQERSTGSDVDKSWKILKALIDEFLEIDNPEIEIGSNGYEIDNEMVASTRTVASTQSSSYSSYSTGTRTSRSNSTATNSLSN